MEQSSGPISPPQGGQRRGEADPPPPPGDCPAGATAAFRGAEPERGTVPLPGAFGRARTPGRSGARRRPERAPAEQGQRLESNHVLEKIPLSLAGVLLPRAERCPGIRRAGRARPARWRRRWPRNGLFAGSFTPRPGRERGARLRLWLRLRHLSFALVF